MFAIVVYVFLNQEGSVLPPFYKHVQEILHFPPILFSNWPYSWLFPWIVAVKPGTCVTDWCVPIIVAGCMVICLNAPVQLIWGPVDLLGEYKHSLFAWLGQARPAQVKSVFVNKMWGWVRMNPHDVFYLRPGLSCVMIGMAVQDPVAVSHMLVLPTPAKDLAKEECYIPACHIIRDNLILHQRDPMFSDLQELIPLLEGGDSQGAAGAAGEV